MIIGDVAGLHVLTGFPAFTPEAYWQQTDTPANTISSLLENFRCLAAGPFVSPHKSSPPSHPSGPPTRLPACMGRRTGPLLLPLLPCPSAQLTAMAGLTRHSTNLQPHSRPSQRKLSGSEIQYIDSQKTSS